MTAEAVAIIPARGGSKGIPRKNVKLLAGKPLIAHTILAARAARTIARVVVSTDDDEIASVAREYGAEVVRRPPALSGDTARSEDALLHALDELAKDGYSPEFVVFLQCTSPLTRAGDIDGTVEALLREGADSALAVTPFYHFLWTRAEDGNAVGVNHDKRVRLRRQEREGQYLEAGAVYVMRTDGFRQARHRFFGKTALYVMPEERVLELDTPRDFAVAELLLASQTEAKLE